MMLQTTMLKEKAKTAALAALPAAASLALPMTSFAAEGDPSATSTMFESVTTGMVTAIQDMVSSVGSTVGAIIPVVFPLVALGIGVSICISMVRRVSSHA